MQYTFDLWKDRHRHRVDLSIYVTHLTKENAGLNTFEVLQKILTEKKLVGSTTASGFIIGTDSAVCFQDGPLYGIAQNCLHEQQNKDELGSKIRYSPVGLSFRKDYVFKKGGRPVIYESKDVAKSILPPAEWWRIVSFDLSGTVIIDWTHEREWRVKGDFTFELSEAIVVLNRTEAYRHFIKNTTPLLIESIAGIVVMDSVLS